MSWTAVAGDFENLSGYRQRDDVVFRIDCLYDRADVSFAIFALGCRFRFGIFADLTVAKRSWLAS